MIFSVISSVLIIISIVCLFGLTPEQVTDDLMRLITPNDTMRDRSRNLRGNKKKHRLYRTLVKMKTALAVTGKSKQFTIVCCASLVLFAAGIILSVLIDNIFLMPVLSVAFALIPFFYTTSTLSYYEKNTKEELETTFPEFAPCIPQCRFTGCSHRSEPGCAVREAVEQGKISRSRYASYLAMYEEASARKAWEK